MKEFRKAYDAYAKAWQSVFNRSVKNIIENRDRTDERMQELCELCGPHYQYDRWHTLGGEALVIRVNNLEQERKEILKVARRNVSENVRTASRFFRGSGIQSKLKGRLLFGVPEVYYTHRDPTYICMEYIHGKPLLDYLNICEEKDALRMFCMVLTLIGTMHEYGVIHRDIKPDNFMVAKHPLDSFIKPIALDFGLAKNMEDSARALTGLGAEIGTRIYASPEQMDDASSATYADDIFSLGKLFYVFLTYKMKGLPESEDDYPEALLPGKYLEIYNYACSPKEFRYRTVNTFLQAVKEAAGLTDDDIVVSLRRDEPAVTVEVTPQPSSVDPAAPSSIDVRQPSVAFDYAEALRGVERPALVDAFIRANVAIKLNITSKDLGL